MSLNAAALKKAYRSKRLVPKKRKRQTETKDTESEPERETLAVSMSERSRLSDEPYRQKPVTDERLQRYRGIPHPIPDHVLEKLKAVVQRKGWIEGWKLVTRDGFSAQILSSVPKQYELNKTTTLGNDDPLVECQNGLHFGVSPAHIGHYVNLYGNRPRLLRVIASGTVQFGEGSSMATNITPVQEYFGADMDALLQPVDDADD